MLLLDRRQQDTCRSLAAQATLLDLSKSPVFSEQYLMGMDLSPLFTQGRFCPRVGTYPPFAKPASPLRLLPNVALSSVAVKAFLLFHKHYLKERIV